MENPNDIVIYSYQNKMLSRKIKKPNSRASRYRGVSRNGMQWQVLTFKFPNYFVGLIGQYPYKAVYRLGWLRT